MAGEAASATAALTLVACSFLSYEHPRYGKIYCQDECAWNRTKPGQLQSCRINCETYFFSCKNLTTETPQYETESQGLVTTPISAKIEQDVGVDPSFLTIIVAVVAAVAILATIALSVILIVVAVRQKWCCFGSRQKVVLRSSLPTRDTGTGAEGNVVELEPLNEAQPRDGLSVRHNPDCSQYASGCTAFIRNADHSRQACRCPLDAKVVLPVNPDNPENNVSAARYAQCTEIELISANLPIDSLPTVEQSQALISLRSDISGDQTCTQENTVNV